MERPLDLQIVNQGAFFYMIQSGVSSRRHYGF